MKGCDLTGKTFGRLTVRSKSVTRGPSNSTYWECVCECGGRSRATTHQLTHGKVVSCGCLFSEMVAERNTKHGMMGHPLYTTWRSMMDRCYRKNCRGHKNYGARGIGVCENWRDFSRFVADMGDKPSPEHSLDRIDNGLGYSASNCRWATRQEQNRNKRVYRANNTGHSGVVRITTKGGAIRYQVCLGKAGKSHYLGRFQNIEDAVSAKTQFLKENVL